MISIWLKVKDRGAVMVNEHLNPWLAAFSDKTKYKIYLYNENCSFITKDTYGDRVILLSRADIAARCPGLKDMVKKGGISDYWTPAATALISPYFYLENEEDEIIVNIDADDMILYGDKNYYIDTAAEIVRNESLVCLSYDLNYSYHVICNLVIPNHWSFGVNIGNKNNMLITIRDACKRILQQPPWTMNIDRLIDIHLNESPPDWYSTKYLAFITPDGLMHCGYHFVKYDEELQKVHSSMTGLDGVPLGKFPLHPRTRLIERKNDPSLA